MNQQSQQQRLQQEQQQRLQSQSQPQQSQQPQHQCRAIQICPLPSPPVQGSQYPELNVKLSYVAPNSQPTNPSCNVVTICDSMIARSMPPAPLAVVPSAPSSTRGAPSSTRFAPTSTRFTPASTRVAPSESAVVNYMTQFIQSAPK